MRGFVRRLAPAGEANALVQVFLRCTAPGVPDCYQGCEFADFSLVVPYNRRRIDFAARAAALDGAPRGFDAIKQRLIARLLRERPEDAGWEPVEAQGPRAGHILAFCRGARLGAAVLRSAAELVEGRDLDKPAMDRTIRTFAEKLANAEAAVNLAANTGSAVDEEPLPNAALRRPPHGREA